MWLVVGRGICFMWGWAGREALARMGATGDGDGRGGGRPSAAKGKVQNHTLKKGDTSSFSAKLATVCAAAEAGQCRARRREGRGGGGARDASDTPLSSRVVGERSICAVCRASANRTPIVDVERTIPIRRADCCE